MTSNTNDADITIGDVIDNRMKVMEIYGGEGRSGMGIVYICRDQQSGAIYALKTFQNQYLASKEARSMFEREALIWVSLGNHPFIVQAKWAQLWEGRLFLVLEYIAPDATGRNSLSHYLPTLTTDKALRMAVQICFGMEHAFACGIEVHRDIKPDNIMIKADETVKITDFGLAKVPAKDIWDTDEGFGDLSNPTGIYQTNQIGKARGTLPYMAEECFLGTANQRSDIFSFGMVLYQMFNKGELPYTDNHGRFVNWSHTDHLVDALLIKIIHKCTAPKATDRYSSFSLLKDDLQDVLQKVTGEIMPAPLIPELIAEELNNIGVALNNLGHYKKAIPYFDRAIEKLPTWSWPWMNKGYALDGLKAHEPALEHYEKALTLKPNYPEAWQNKGVTYIQLNRYKEALACSRKAVSIAPKFLYAWYTMASCLNHLGRYQEALDSCHKALAISRRFANVWLQMAVALDALGQTEEALSAIRTSLSLNPDLWSAKALENKLKSRQ
jgi:eukaryotic-like serine/threonine-protein kinase